MNDNIKSMFHSKVSVLLLINIQVKGCKAVPFTKVNVTGWTAITGFHTPS
uniref:Uncharacterized protein n=1 Tax=Arion vulgaris TaxID=1028688 RepID=A0A0B7BC50_9EUPU